MAAPLRPTTIRRLIAVAAVLGLFWPLGTALAALSGINHRWVDILAQFTAPALLAAVVLTVVAGLVGTRLGTAFGLISAVLCLIAGWPQWRPPMGEPRPDAPVATLYFANLYMSNRDVPAIARSIQEANADIVVLVEMSDTAARQIDTLLADFPHRAIERHAKGRLGDRIVVASRWPLTAAAKAEHRVAHTAATVQTPWGSIDVIGVHLTRPWPYQYQWSQITQAMALTELVQEQTHPVIVAGDFNSVSSARIGRQLRQDASLIPAPGWPGTWPAQIKDVPIPSPAAFTIDQVYRTGDLAFVERRLGRRSGSDHRPVIVRFTASR